MYIIDSTCAFDGISSSTKRSAKKLLDAKPQDPKLHHLEFISRLKKLLNIFKMKRKMDSNQMSQKTSRYKATGTKFRKLNVSVQDVVNSDEIPSSSRSAAAHNVSSPFSGQGNVLKILKEVKRGQQEIHNFMNNLDRRLAAIEKTLREKMPEKAEVKAQSRILKTVHNFATKHQQSLNRITGDIEDEEYIEIASKLPLSSEESLRFVEEKLQTKASTEAMMRFLIKAKRSKDSVDGVLRSLLTDDLVYHYNLEGRKERRSLLQLKSMAIIMDIFPDMDKDTLLTEIRTFVALSHNRLKQKKHKIKARLY